MNNCRHGIDARNGLFGHNYSTKLDYLGHGHLGMELLSLKNNHIMIIFLHKKRGVKKGGSDLELRQLWHDNVAKYPGIRIGCDLAHHSSDNPWYLSSDICGNFH